jgi:transcriptional regulator with XRE-family HTH domain
MPKPWNEKLRELRKLKDLTQTELAMRAKLSQGLISGLERGKKKFTQSVLDKILNILDATYRDIFCDKTKEEMEIELELLRAKIKILELTNSNGYQPDIVKKTVGNIGRKRKAE